MQNELFKLHPSSMFWEETVSLEFWTIPRHSVGIYELDDQKAISSSQVLIYSILRYELCFFWKEMCVHIQSGSSVHSVRDSVWHKEVRAVKHEHTYFLVWTQTYENKACRQASHVLCFPSFSLVHPATNRNDFAFGEKWKPWFLCQCTSARNDFTCVQLNQSI